MKYLVFHIGLGDAIICNGLINKLSEHEKILVPCYEHNRESIEFMFFDNYNVLVDAVKDEKEMLSRSTSCQTLSLGYYAGKDFDDTRFDQEFYRQAGIDFSERWKAFKYPEPQFYIDIPDEPFIFVHNDLDRGFRIEGLDKKILHFKPHLSISRNIFDYVPLLEQAEEIHCFNSSFLCLVDSLETVDAKLFFHTYVRPTCYPTLKKKWNVLTAPLEMP